MKCATSWPTYSSSAAGGTSSRQQNSLFIRDADLGRGMFASDCTQRIRWGSVFASRRFSPFSPMAFIMAVTSALLNTPSPSASYFLNKDCSFMRSASSRTAAEAASTSGSASTPAGPDIPSAARAPAQTQL